MIERKITTTHNVHNAEKKDCGKKVLKK